MPWAWSHAKINLRATNYDPAASILRNTTLGDIEPGHNLKARQQALRHSQWRCGHSLQKTVDTQTHPQRPGKRLDVKIGCTLFDRRAQKFVERTHDRRAARKIAQIVKIIGSNDRLRQRVNGRGIALLCGGKGGIEILARGNRKHDFLTKCDLHRAQGFNVDRRRDGQNYFASRVGIRVKPALSQKPARERCPAKRSPASSLRWTRRHP